jgi:hypothetical protein
MESLKNVSTDTPNWEADKEGNPMNLIITRPDEVEEHVIMKSTITVDPKKKILHRLEAAEEAKNLKHKTKMRAKFTCRKVPLTKGLTQCQEDQEMVLAFIRKNSKSTVKGKHMGIIT